MSGYAYVNQVTDPNAQKSLKTAYDLIGALRSELDALKAQALTSSAAINVHGQRLTNLPSPQGASDAASAGYVQTYVSAQIESFKGAAGIDGTIDTATTQTIQVKNGLIVGIA